MADRLTELGYSARQVNLILRGPTWASVEQVVGRRISARSVPETSPAGDPSVASSNTQDPTLSSPAQPASSARQELIPLYWTKASILLSGTQDPYNAQYVAAAKAKELKGRDFLQGDSGKAVSAGFALATTALAALSSTPIGAIAAALLTATELIGQYVVPPSQGGFEKLTPLQRQRTVLYKLHPDFEAQRNQTLYASQKMDLTVPDLGPRQVAGSLPGTWSTQPAQIHDNRYPLYLRNQLIRTAYRMEFQRVVNTPDEPTLPAVLINILAKAKLWPPPLPPAKPQYFGPPTGPSWRVYGVDDGMPRATDFDRQILEVQYKIVYAQYLADLQQFAQVAALAQLPGELQTLAAQTGSIPELGAPGVFTLVA